MPGLAAAIASGGSAPFTAGLQQGLAQRRFRGLRRQPDAEEETGKLGIGDTTPLAPIGIKARALARLVAAGTVRLPFRRSS